MQSPLIQPTYVTFVNTVQYKPYTPNGGLFVVKPQVLYNSVVYQYNGAGTAATSSTYDTPDIDPNAVALYKLGAGTIVRAYASIQGISGAVSTGNLSLSGTTNQLSSNVTAGASALTVPNGVSFMLEVVQSITTAGTSGVTLAITGTNATVQTQAIVLGASLTANLTALRAFVKTTGASPTVSLTASSVTGTVTANATNSIWNLWQVS